MSGLWKRTNIKYKLCQVCGKELTLEEINESLNAIYDMETQRIEEQDRKLIQKQIENMAELQMSDGMKLSTILDKYLPADGMGTEREQLRTNLHREILEMLTPREKEPDKTSEELAEQFLVWAENGWNLKGAYDDNQKEGQESASWEVIRPYYKSKLGELFESKH